jgi:pimeloyl-ACP methyl ester carboxylesterase
VLAITNVLARLAGAVLLLACCGCADPPRRLTSAPRYARGVVYVLPGIEGPSPWNRDLAIGLADGGVRCAIQVYDWTTSIPGAFLINLTDLERNRRQAQKLADDIVNYRNRHPGCPVHLIGHSGGAGIAVLALEALPPGRQIDSAILLAPALSREYDLSVALRRTRTGIVNFYSPRDGMLTVGTSLFGPIDRRFGVAAGAEGFVPPATLSDAERALYGAKLAQHEWDDKLERYGASGSHLGWTSRRFAAQFLAPLIRRNELP